MQLAESKKDAPPKRWPHNLLSLEGDLQEANRRILMTQNLYFAGGGGEDHIFIRVYLLLPPSTPFLLNGNQTHASRGLGPFICIVTVILRFAAKKQSIKFASKEGKE